MIIRNRLKLSFTGANLTCDDFLIRAPSKAITHLKVRAYASNDASEARRYAIIGGGFAGVATAWHLLKTASAAAPHRPTHIDLYDAFGLGSGGSGAAAGLLHPYNARGKLLYQGLEAFQDALDLVNAAEQHSTTGQQIAWRHGLLRPAKSLKQATALAKFVTKDADAYPTTLAHCVNAQELSQLVPGIDPSLLDDDSNSSNNHQVRGMMIPVGLVLQPIRYLHALWDACQHIYPNATAQIHIQPVTSLSQLVPSYDAIIVAAGAAIDTIEETKGLLSLELCHGHTIHATPANHPLDPNNTTNSNTMYPSNAPSLLGPTYIAAHGPENLVIGATKRYGVTVEEAYTECSKQHSASSHNNDAEITTLMQQAAAIWPPLGESYRVTEVVSGVRAIPRRNEQGSVPYAGQLPESNGRYWLVGGLGARGLTYHAWLGRLVAEAVVTGDELILPSELRRWKQTA